MALYTGWDPIIVFKWKTCYAPKFPLEMLEQAWQRWEPGETSKAVQGIVSVMVAGKGCHSHLTGVN